MKLLFVVFLSALAVSAQDPQAAAPAKKSAGKPAPKAVAKAASKTPAANVKDGSKPMPIPSTAVLAADGDYHFTDPQGKKWLYRKTPFGVARMEDNAQTAATRAPSSTSSGIKATEVGDKVVFERQGPFGVWKWEKNKSEMDEGERAALAHSQAANKTASQD